MFEVITALSLSMFLFFECGVGMDGAISSRAHSVASDGALPVDNSFV